MSDTQYQLNIAAILRRAEQFYGTREVVTRLNDRSFHRYTFTDLAQRARQLGSALQQLDLKPGARIATLCWSHYQHAELYFGGPIAGYVTHPINPRLHVDDIAFIASHAEDDVLFIDRSFAEIYEAIRDRTPFKHVYFIGSQYEDFLSTGDPGWQPENIDENTSALTTYTSGTTGRPKGVFVSHRAIALHTLSSALNNWLAFRDSDVVMPIVPLFHALGWGWPYSCALLGAKLVLPGPLLDPISILENVELEQVTVSGGVPTVWMGMLQALDDEPKKFEVSTLRAILSGGATAPPAMIDGYRERHGLNLVHTWGMTELIMGVIADPSWDASPELQKRQGEKQGRAMPFLEIRARNDDGIIPWDGETLGELEVYGPWVSTSYTDAAESAAQWTKDGWFRTGDIVSIDERGYFEIADRTKDVIKSGGEWISTPQLESALMAHPAVAEAAVIGVQDQKWSERPLAAIVLRTDLQVSAEELRDHLGPLVAKFWIPERIEFIGEIPRTAVGKFNKVALRQQFDIKNT
jgi:fatty-acyl-CoA synthase|tara:strand:+ start:2181 stop:3746 length:1566 start_codon:yes stop_codon:yes gene_type:complete